MATPSYNSMLGNNSQWDDLYQNNLDPKALNALKNHLMSKVQEPSPPSLEARSYRTQILRLRMRWVSDEGPFQCIHHEFLKSKNTVALIIIHKDEIIVLEDGAELFPSDTLLAQIRLLAD